MNLIEELFGEIKEEEMIEIETTMDDMKKSRIEKLIIKGILDQDKTEKNEIEKNEIEKNDTEKNETEKNDTENNVIENNETGNNETGYNEIEKNEFYEKNIKNPVFISANRMKKRSKRKWFALILAATLLLGVSGYASEKNNWDKAISSYMGIENPEKVKLKDSVVTIDAKSFSNGVTMKAVTSVGDKNSVYIRIDTDYKLPSTFDDKKDYIIPNDYSIMIMKEVGGITTNYGSTFNYFNNDGFLSFMLYIMDCKGVNKKNISIKFKDLKLYHDLGDLKGDIKDKDELLVMGEWNLNWKYNYPSNVTTYHPMKFVKSKGANCFVTKIELSPITLRVEAIKNPKHGKTETSGLTIEKITMKDGSVINLNGNGGSGIRNNMFLEAYCDVLGFGKAIDPSGVKSITVGDRDIILD